MRQMQILHTFLSKREQRETYPRGKTGRRRELELFVATLDPFYLARHRIRLLPSSELRPFCIPPEISLAALSV